MTTLSLFLLITAIATICLNSANGFLINEEGGQALINLAREAADRIDKHLVRHRALSNGDDQGGDSSWDQESFKNRICTPFRKEFLTGAPSGSACGCNSHSYTITCSGPSVCGNDDSCGQQQQVCERRTVQVDWTARGDFMVLTSLALESRVSGTDYDGERAVITEDACAQYFYLNGLEYQCLSCTICDGSSHHLNGTGTRTGVDLDCSNIQPQAVEDTCFESTSMTGDVSTFFEYCPDGGAPEPTTEGQSPNQLGSTSSAVTTAAVFFNLVATTLAIAALSIALLV